MFDAQKGGTPFVPGLSKGVPHGYMPLPSLPTTLVMAETTWNNPPALHQGNAPVIMTSRPFVLITLQIKVCNVWSFPVSETNICCKESAAVMNPSMQVRPRNKTRKVESYATSQALRSVTVRRDFWRRICLRGGSGISTVIGITLAVRSPRLIRSTARWWRVRRSTTRL